MTEVNKQENKREPINNDKKTKDDEYLDPETKKFKKGNPGGPGRPKGTRDWKTDFDEAIKKIAKKTGVPVSEIRTDLLVRGIAEARKGNYNFWNVLVERNYGKAVQPIEGDFNIKGAGDLAKALQDILDDDETKKSDKKTG